MSATDKKILQGIRELRLTMVSSMNVLIEHTELQTKQLESLGSAMQKSGKGKAKKGGFSNVLFGNLNDFFKNMSQMAQVTGELRRGLKKFKKVEHEGRVFTDFIRDMANAITMDGDIKEPSDIAKMYNEFGKAFERVADNTPKLARGLVMISIAEKLKGSEMFKQAMENVFDKTLIDKLDPERALDASIAMRHMAGTMSIFALTSITVAPILVATSPLMAAGMLVMKGAAELMSWIGRSVSDDVEPAAHAIKKISVSMMVFAGSMALSAGILMGMGTAILGGMAVMGLALTVFGVTYSLLGETADEIRKGSGAVSLMGLSLVAFSFGLHMMSKMTDSKDLGTYMSVALTLTAFSLAYALAGGLWTTIMKGSLAVTTIAASIFILGFGMDKLMDSKYFQENDWETFGLLMATIGGLSIGYSLIGLALPFVLMGSLAIGLIGGSLWLLGKGVSEFTESGAEKFDREAFVNVMGGLREGFTELISGGLFTAAKVSVAVAASMGMGKALSSMAKGVGAWANLQNIPLIKGYDEDGQPVYSGETADVDSAINNIIKFIGDGSTKGILLPFITLSNKANLDSGTSLLKGVLGGDLGSTPFIRGVRGSIKIGKALSSMAEGVGAWANLQNIPLIKGYDDEGNPEYSGKSVDINKAITNINTALSGEKSILTPFVKLSNKANLDSGFSLSKLLFGGDLGRSPFMLGVRASIKIGKALSSVAEGVGAWANLQNIPLIKGYDKEGNPEYEGSVNINTALGNIRTALTDKDKGVLAPFIALSNTANLDSGFSLSKIIFGGDLGRSPFMLGVRASIKIGKALSSVAEGVGGFMNLENIPVITGYDEEGRPQYDGGKKVKLKTALTNVNIALEDMFDTFSDVSRPRKIKKAVKAIKPIGGILSGMAEAFETFANLNNIKIIEKYEWKEELGRNVPKYKTGAIKIDDISDNVKTAITSVIDAIESAEGRKAKPLKKGAKAIGKHNLGASLSGIAEAFETFANLNNIKIIEKYEWKEELGRNVPKYSSKTVSIDTIKKNVSTAISAVSGSLSDIEKIGRTKRGAKAMAEAGSSLSDMARYLKSFADVKDPKQLASDILVTVVKLGAAFDKTSEYDLKSMEDMADPIKTIATGLGRFEDFKDVSLLGSQVASAVNSVTGSMKKGDGDFMDKKHVDELNSVLRNLSDTDIADNSEVLRENMVKMIDSINTVSDAKMEAMENFMAKVVEFEDVSTRNLRKNVEQVKELVDEISDAEVGSELADTVSALNDVSKDASPESKALSDLSEKFDALQRDNAAMKRYLSQIAGALQGKLKVSMT